MAEFITKRENARRLAIIIVCVLADAVAAAVIIYAFKEINYLEKKPENANNIGNLVKKVREGRKANEELQKNLLGYGRTIGWKVDATGTTDRFTTGPLQNDVLRSFLSSAARPSKEDEARGVKSMLQYLNVADYKRWDDQGGGKNLHLNELFDELLKKENEFKTKIGDLESQIKADREKEETLKKDTEAANVAAQK